MLGRQCLLALCSLIFVCLVGPANSETVEVTGGMTTTAKFLDHISITVPSNVDTLTVRIPVPTDSNLFGYSQVVGDVRVVSSRTPDSTSAETDNDGNRYDVDEFRHPASGTIIFTIFAGSAKISVDLNQPLPYSPAYLTDIPSDAAQYLKPTDKVQSDDPIIMSLANNFLAGAEDEATVASRIQQWLQRNVTYDPAAEGGPDDALYVLSHKVAICDGWAHLFLALARADGIPARFIGGYNLGGEINYPLDTEGNSTLTVSCDDKPHSWVEVWFPGTGWVPFEPQDSAGFVDSHHLSVWAGEDADTVQSMVTWSSYDTSGQKFTLSEEEMPTKLNDHVDVSCASTDGGPASFTTLERTRGADSVVPNL